MQNTSRSIFFLEIFSFLVIIKSYFHLEHSFFSDRRGFFLRVELQSGTKYLEQNGEI